MASSSSFPSMYSDDEWSHLPIRQPMLRCDALPPPLLLPLPFPPVGTRHRRQRRQRSRRHASSVGSNSTTTPSTTTSLPTLSELHSFPPLEDNNTFWRHNVNRLKNHVARLVRGGTALFWHPTQDSDPTPPPKPPPSPSPSPSHSLFTCEPYMRSKRIMPLPIDDEGNCYCQRIRLPTPHLRAQADTPMPVFPPVDFS